MLLYCALYWEKYSGDPHFPLKLTYTAYKFDLQRIPHTSYFLLPFLMLLIIKKKNSVLFINLSWHMYIVIL